VHASDLAEARCNRSPEMICFVGRAAKMNVPANIQGSLFEEDYLLRTLGKLAQSPDSALTELVANAWDAGASCVEIVIPEEYNQSMSVQDDGAGMTPEQFKQRWMKLGYDRLKHQGSAADFPPDRTDWSRRAFGRNGVGRHGLLCFGNEYQVATIRGGHGSKFVVRTSEGSEPFVLAKERLFKAKGHGTKLTTLVVRNLPAASHIQKVLSARFLHDPRFTVVVNGVSVPLWEHSGLIDRADLDVDGVAVEVFFIDSTKAARTTQHQGIAFWIGGRLLGVPSWILGLRSVMDGRTRIAKRHTVVVKADEFSNEALPDWSGFKDSKRVDRLYEVVGDYVENMFRRLSKERVNETAETVYRDNREEIESLRPLARIGVAEFVERYTQNEPMVQVESLSVAVRAVIQMEKTRSGAALLEKIAKLSEEDIEGLNRLLESWSVRDAATVLEEIDRRLIVVEALSRLSGDKKADELHTLHPLVTESRWLFGPEFDTPEFTSNVSLTTAVRELFNKRATETTFLNPRKRPDLLVLAESTVSAVATEQFDDSTGLSTMREILLLELKRGQVEISRENLNQATDYVDDLLSSGLIDGVPCIRAFVIGHRVNEKMQTVRTVGESNRGRVLATTYNQLVRTAHKRLFRLKDQLAGRYEELSTPDLLTRVLREPFQPKLESPGMTTDGPFSEALGSHATSPNGTRSDEHTRAEA